MTQAYPIGRPGQPWNQEEKQQWFNVQTIKRSYADEVVGRLKDIVDTHEVEQYGALPIDSERYPLFAIKPKSFNPELPDILVTGGVHGYETSGVQGALDFACNEIANYTGKANVFVLPCISPWGYETINRWGANAVDPNRSFYPDSPSAEAAAAMQFVESEAINPLLHIDLHETTDTDNSEFRPALAARDAIDQAQWEIPDGFYLVADTNKPELAFQKAIIESVRKITHIAPADKNGKIIGADVRSDGVIDYDTKKLFLCAGMTDAAYVSTTEVYPDSPKTNEAECNKAQVAAVTSAIDFSLDA
jgi:hypothetical protein